MTVNLSTNWIYCDDCNLYFVIPEAYVNPVTHPCMARIPFEPPIKPLAKPLVKPMIEPLIKPHLNAIRQGIRRKPNLNPRCPECNGITEKQGTVVTKKKGIRQIFRCTECACGFRLPYTHPDISAADEPIGKGMVNLIACGKILQNKSSRFEKNRHEGRTIEKWERPTHVTQTGALESISGE